MLYLCILVLAAFLNIASAFADQEKTDNTQSNSSSTQNSPCEIDGNIIRQGVCIEDHYYRLPKNSFRHYSIDLEKSIAFYFEIENVAHFNEKNELIYSKPKVKQKTITLNQKQTLAIQTLTRCVVDHVATYQEAAKQKRTDEWEKYWQQIKEQDESIARESEICKKQNNCPKEITRSYIFRPDEFDDIPPFIPQISNDLVEQSFHFSQTMNIKNKTDDLTFGGGGRELTKEASNLLSNIEQLFPNKTKRY